MSRLPGLRVISRTSAFAFKGQKLHPREIGRKLGVDQFSTTPELTGSGPAVSSEALKTEAPHQTTRKRWHNSS